jgi:tripartite ATP-independent transporter DctP family solute receptor
VAERSPRPSAVAFPEQQEEAIMRLARTIPLLGLALHLSVAAGWAQAPTVIRFGGPGTLEQAEGKAQQLFKKIVEQDSQGRIRVDLFPLNQLGDLREQIEAVQQGTQEMAYATPAWLSAFVPQASVLSFPYLFKDVESAHRLLDGEIGKEISRIAEESRGIKILSFWEVGFRHLSNSVRPVRKLADVKGLKVRLQADPVHLETYRIFGANPVSLPWVEVYTALQQRVIDGFETPYATLFFNRFYEVVKHVTHTAHWYDSYGVYINAGFFKKLAPDLQQVLVKAAAESAKQQRQQQAKDEVTVVDQLKAKGMTVTPLGPAELDEFKKAAEPVYEKFEAKLGKAFVQRVVEAARR